MEHFLTAITSLCVTVVVGIAGWLGGKVSESRRSRKEERQQLADIAERVGAIEKALEEEKPKKEALYKGMKAEIRESLVDAHKQYVDEGEPLTVERFHELTEGYEAYSALGGNGTGKRMYREIARVPMSIASR